MCKFKSLILSFDSYSWVKNCSGIISENPNLFEVIIFSDDSYIPIYNCKFLCKQSVYEQRRFDVFNIGKLLGIKKISNFMYNEKNDLTKYIVQLQFLLMINGINRIYCQDNKLLRDLISALKKQLNIEVYFFDGEKRNIFFALKDENIKIKCNALRLITGFNNPNDKYIKEINMEYFDVL